MADYYAYILIVFLLFIIIIQSEKARISEKWEKFEVRRGITDRTIAHNRKAIVVRKHVA